MKYFVYATFKALDKEAVIDSATCTIYQNGNSSVASGVMTRISNGIFFYEFEYEQAGTYLARCIASRVGADNLLDTKVFEIVEDIRPQYLNIEPIENKLAEIKTKLGVAYSESLESLLHELTSYSTGTSPIPNLYPITAMNCKFPSIPGNAIVTTTVGIGITGAKVSFYPNNDINNNPYITYTSNGYWGVYIPAGVYLVRIDTGFNIFEDVLEVLE